MRQLLGMMAVLLVVPPTTGQIVFDPPRIDQGTVKAGQVATHRVNVRNAGREGIEITDLKTSCGCLAPTLEPRILPPGGTAVLSVRVNTLSSSPGLQAFVVKLKGRSATGPLEALFQVTATVVQEVVVTPAAMTIHGGERPMVREIEVRDRRPRRSLRVLRVEGSSPLVAGSVKSEGEQHQVVVTLAGNFPVGTTEAEVILYTDDGEYPQLRVPITVIRKPPTAVAVAPRLAVLAANSPGENPSRVITLRDQVGCGLKLERIDCSDPALTAEVRGRSESTLTLQLRLHRKHQGTNDRFRGEVRIAIQGVAEPIVVPVEYQPADGR